MDDLKVCKEDDVETDLSRQTVPSADRLREKRMFIIGRSPLELWWNR